MTMLKTMLMACSPIKVKLKMPHTFIIYTTIWNTNHMIVSAVYSLNNHIRVNARETLTKNAYEHKKVYE